MSERRRISVAFQTDKRLGAYGPRAAAAERHGFDVVSVYNDLLYQPAWLPLLEMARATRRAALLLSREVLAALRS
jgi:5,10-methylenetetrahydromethanopterin reductase